MSRRDEVLELWGRLKTSTHFEVLGIGREAALPQVKDAYFRLAKRFHPDVVTDPGLADLRDKLDAIFIRLGEAYDVLREPENRRRYESDLAARAPRPGAGVPAAPPPPAPADDQPASLDPRIINEALRKAQLFFNEQKYWDAIQQIESVVEHLSGRPKAKAKVLLAQCFMKNPNWIRRAEEQIQEVMAEDPKYAEAHFVMGQIYKAGGLKARAASMFRKVLELKPDHAEAASEYASVAPPAVEEAPKEGGLFKKFFGKS